MSTPAQMTAERIGLQMLPQVSIVLPVYNDEEWIGSALESCLAQTLADIEVIVVDDASTDATTEIVERYRSLDPRITLIRQERNRTAFQARRRGIEAASARYVLFLDGDDQLAPEAAETAMALAERASADVVSFGVSIVRPDGTSGGGFERSLEPQHAELRGSDILPTLFPIGKTAQGQLWRYLFSRELLRSTYDAFPPDLELWRVNDLPIVFAAMMHARKYVSTTAKLYRYFFRRGASGHQMMSFDDYLFTAGAIDSIDALAKVVEASGTRGSAQQRVAETYASVRLSVIGRVLKYVVGVTDSALQHECLTHLSDRVGSSVLVEACADSCPSALPLLVRFYGDLQPQASDAKHILLRVGSLRTGGTEGVVVAQAGYLVNAGYQVTIAVDRAPRSPFPLPPGVRLVHVRGESLTQRIREFARYCTREQVDLVIDHWIFYNDLWPYFALAAAALRVPTIGWLHTFALRPIVEGTQRLSFLERNVPLLHTLVVLSKTDVAYWKLRGVKRVVWLPNPPSPLLLTLPPRETVREAPAERIELVWWGRLQQSTKQVRELIEIGSELKRRGTPFRLTIIGPDGPDLTGRELRELARSRDIADSVDISPTAHGDALVKAVDHAHIFVSTSLIEGYQLTLVEAQAMALPVVMYDLPWLAVVEDNQGIVSVPQHDRAAAAEAIVSLARDPEGYTFASRSSIEAAERARAYDFAGLYSSLIRGVLPADYSPEPDEASVRVLLDQNVRYVERLASSVDGPARGERMSSRNPSPPSVPRSGWKGLLQRVLPATMRQTSFFARHQFATSLRQHQESMRLQRELGRRIDRVELLLTELSESVTNGLKTVERVEQNTVTSREFRRGTAGLRRVSDEIVWSQVFHDTVAQSTWFTDQALSPGRWAVGYPFLYVLYRVLDEMRPASTLELGLGQSTKIIAQHTAAVPGNRHRVVEHDRAWVEAFSQNYRLPDGSEIVHLEMIEVDAPDGTPVRRYDGFQATLGQDRYDLIVIDGPFGFRQNYSRIDVLDLIPESLGDRFVIMLDDVERAGEQATIGLITEALDRAGIEYVATTYRGAKDVWVATHPDLAFFTSL